MNFTQNTENREFQPFFSGDFLIELYLVNRFLYLFNKTLENGNNCWKCQGFVSQKKVGTMTKLEISQ